MNRYLSSKHCFGMPRNLTRNATNLRRSTVSVQDKYLGNIYQNSNPTNFSRYWNQATTENSGRRVP